MDAAVNEVKLPLAVLQLHCPLDENSIPTIVLCVGRRRRTRSTTACSCWPAREAT